MLFIWHDTVERRFPDRSKSDMFHRNKKSVRIVSSIIIILVVLAMLASILLYLI